MMFDKYVDFIDVYAGVREDEREAIFREMTEQEESTGGCNLGSTGSVG
jgi:hypothetical protein